MEKDILQIRNSMTTLISGNATALIRYPVTVTDSNITGDELAVSGASGAVNWLFANRTTKQFLDKSGKFESADAFVIAPYNATLNKEDIIIAGGSEYRVETAEIRRYMDSGIYVYGVLRMVD